MLEPLLKEQIAIDGPVASGKSAVGLEVARQLRYGFLDTGIMYRAATWLVLDRGIDPGESTKVVESLRATDMEIIPARPAQGITTRVLVDRVDITDRLRASAVEQAVSPVSSIPEVRRMLIDRQRAIANTGPIVMVGRDIGTIVIPHAPLKIFLSASPHVRSLRRWRERQERGENIDIETVRDEIARRDALDDRTTPLRPAPGAHVIETDELSLDAVVERITALAQCRS